MTQDLLNELRDALSTTEPDVSAFILIDPSMHPDIRRRVNRGHPTCATLELPGAVTQGDAEDVLPFLVRVPDEADRRDRLLLQSLEWAAEFHSATWLLSNLPIRALAQSLGVRMDAQLCGGIRVVLRFADARVLRPLHDVLDVQQRDQFLSGVNAWWHLDREERLQHLPSANASDALPATLHLSQEQEDHLLEVAQTDAVLLLLKQEAFAELQRLERHQRYAFVSMQIDVAERCGLQSTIQLTQFCMLALQRGSDFHASDRWQAALRKVRAGEIDMAQAAIETE